MNEFLDDDRAVLARGGDVDKSDAILQHTPSPLAICCYGLGWTRFELTACLVVNEQQQQQQQRQVGRPAGRSSRGTVASVPPGSCQQPAVKWPGRYDANSV